MDVKDGRAVHARGGDRAHYAPVRSILHEGSDPIGLAIAYKHRLDSTEIYLADLDAIAGSRPLSALYRTIHDLDLTLRLDCGIRSAEDAAPLIESGVGVVIAGLETISGPTVLDDLVSRFGPDRVAFSLDLRDGRPLVETDRNWGTTDPFRLAEMALQIGVRRLILLDLARVGSGTGTGTIDLLQALRKANPTIDLVAGGGISGPEDLRILRDAGASAALVGSALHDGRIGETGWPCQRRTPSPPLPGLW